MLYVHGYKLYNKYLNVFEASFITGERYKPETYWPISHNSIRHTFKLLEHMVVSTIMEYVEEHQNHHLEQYGFCWGRTCESQLLGFVDVVSAAVEKGCQEDVLIMDFSEAFDKVSNSLLVHKLPQYGISGRVNRWVENFLRSSEHRQFHQWLKIAFVPVESGVP